MTYCTIHTNHCKIFGFLLNRHARTASARPLMAMTALLPAEARTQWAEEGLGELHTLLASLGRPRFAANTLLGAPHLPRPLSGPAAAGRVH
jgi:hypothetical protein